MDRMAGSPFQPMRTPAVSRCHQVTDWCRSDKDIGAELGITPHAVTMFRRNQMMPGFLKERWNVVDWSQRNVDIAKQLGVHPTAVWYQRRKREKDKTI